eukprot:jgi/Botrbrau1/19685/Bobra.0003s0047.2
MGHISSSSPGVKEETAMGATLKPLLRGVSHQHAFFAAVSAGAMLVLSAPTKEGKLACLIYAATLSTLFGVSAVYHRRTWNPEARALMRRLDHSSIFLLIAGTYTPLCVVSLHQTVSRRLLWWVWAGALAGISQKLLWVCSTLAPVTWHLFCPSHRFPCMLLEKPTTSACGLCTYIFPPWIENL